MSKRARRVPRRVPWKDALTLDEIDNIIAHFTSCGKLYKEFEKQQQRDLSIDIRRTQLCVEVWTIARQMKVEGQSISTYVAERLSFRAPERAEHDAA